MKALLIILALVAASFLAVLAYGLARDPSPAPPSEQTGCGGAPPETANGKINKEAMEDWCPPDVLSSLGGLQRRFGPGVEVERPEVTLEGSGRQDVRQVPPDLGEKHRIANLQLVSGDWASIAAKGDQKVCLCRPGAVVPAAELSGCGDRWIAKQTDPIGCLDEADRNSLPFGELGGSLTFASARPAIVRVR